MLRIPRRYAHFLFAIMQSALTSSIAAAIASISLFSEGMFLRHWLHASLLAWLAMLPFVIFFAPFLDKFSVLLTEPDRPGSAGAPGQHQLSPTAARELDEV
jgi:hypothetical protein